MKELELLERIRFQIPLRCRVYSALLFDAHFQQNQGIYMLHAYMCDDENRQESENIPKKTEVNWLKLMNTK